MSPSLFNSSSETAARLLMALPIINRPASLDEITAIDLVATYMQFFGYGNRNLHGDNEFTLAEYEARRARVEAGLKRLVRSGYALSNKQATSFTAAESAINQQTLLDGGFADEYRTAVKTLVEQQLIGELVQRTTQGAAQ